MKKLNNAELQQPAVLLQARVFLKYFDYFLSHLTETLTIYYLYPCDGWIFTKTPKSNQMIRCRRRNDVVERSETAS